MQTVNWCTIIEDRGGGGELLSQRGSLDRVLGPCFHPGPTLVPVSGVLGLIRYYGYSGGLFFVKFEKIWKNLEKFGKTVGLYRGQLLPNDGQEPRLRGGEVEIWGGGGGVGRGREVLAKPTYDV